MIQWLATNDRAYHAMVNLTVSLFIVAAAFSLFSLGVEVGHAATCQEACGEIGMQADLSKRPCGCVEP
jgi:hypothetical protein